MHPGKHIDLWHPPSDSCLLYLFYPPRSLNNYRIFSPVDFRDTWEKQTFHIPLIKHHRDFSKRLVLTLTQSFRGPGKEQDNGDGPGKRQEGEMKEKGPVENKGEGQKTIVGEGVLSKGVGDADPVQRGNGWE